MSTDRRRIVLFDLFGVLALHQRPGALEKMAARCHTSLDAFTTAYWTYRPPYDAGRHTASAYWTDVLHALSRPADADTIEELRLTDIDSWSRVNDPMVTYVRNLRKRARVALLSNIPADHADVFLAAQSWLHDLEHVAFSGKIGAAKRDPVAFQHCVTTLHAAPADFLFVDVQELGVAPKEDLRACAHVVMTHPRAAEQLSNPREERSMNCSRRR